MYSQRQPYAPPTSSTTYRTLAPRSAAFMKPPPSRDPPTMRAPSPPSRAHIRSVSVTSFLSDGTVEIEGFGFDDISTIDEQSEIGDGEHDSNRISTYAESAYTESLYEGSQFGDDDTRSEFDLSMKAEKILASAKRKLDLCGRNISRARSSLILSPSATPTALLEHLESVGPQVRKRAESAGGKRPMQWVYNQRQENPQGGASHLRTNSESAVVGSRAGGTFGKAGGGATLNMGALIEEAEGAGEQQREHIHHQFAPQPQIAQRGAGAGVSRNNSVQQMRVLRDQMKDLRGKITTLQEQTKTDSIKRRESNGSLRSTPAASQANTPQHGSPTSLTAPSLLSEIRESRVLNISQNPIEDAWIKDQRQQNRETIISLDSEAMESYSDQATPIATRFFEDSRPSTARDSTCGVYSRDSTAYSRDSRDSTFAYENYLQSGVGPGSGAFLQSSASSITSPTSPTADSFHSFKSPVSPQNEFRSYLQSSTTSPSSPNRPFSILSTSSVSSASTVATLILPSDSVSFLQPRDSRISRDSRDRDSRTVTRKSSFASNTSFATANETPLRSPEPPNSPPGPINIQRSSNHPSHFLDPSGPTLLRPVQIDDGYHSAPHTPQAALRILTSSLAPPTANGLAQSAPGYNSNSWYRDSVDTVRSRSVIFEPGVPESIDGDINDSDSDYTSNHYSHPHRHSNHQQERFLSPANPNRVSGGTFGGGGLREEEELGLGVNMEDKALIEAVCVALGEVCVGVEKMRGVGREEMRGRLRTALAVLRGELEDEEEGRGGEVF
ncbi:Similar to hypothetical protein [Tuber melanosporum Mel28]; acc. no. XP_002841948 [Pyronema omphalodes CBS 100304]|uniref:Uncharacterized protein n=1 Tax=Pyronema omphalodes (strain CBS 100304) TaxID=1076935 RepID=U4L2V7_PYROM|nr:Similar to hypothetical protein [Tuber melanosporum Mel28]; acc. no. XP_002841948 [Pyronema omphalodes CBS 100304]